MKEEIPMKLEQLKDEYPKTPKMIHDRILQTVEEQMKATSGTSSSDTKKVIFVKRSWKKTAAFTLAAVLTVGATAFAGSQIYKWYTQKEGNYGLKINGVTENTSAPEQIPVLSVTPAYLPEGMQKAQDGSDKYSFSSTPNQGGLSMFIIAMDTSFSSDTLPLADTHVTSFEEVEINGQNALYLEFNRKSNGQDIVFDKKIYISYPEYWQILEINLGADISKEDALKIAQNLKVSPTGKTQSLSEQVCWSDMLNNFENASPEKGSDTADLAKEEKAASKLLNTSVKGSHKVGEDFPLWFTLTSSAKPNELSTADDSIHAKVSKVQVADDLSLLDKTYMDDRLLAAADSDGKLVKNRIQYIQSGDGIHTLDKTLYTEEVPLKLVYLTVEFTNTGKYDLSDICYYARFESVIKKDGKYVFYDRAAEDGNDDTDTIIDSGYAFDAEMDYYDITDSSKGNGKNNISSLKPGETKIIHIGKLVNADELDKLYLNLYNGTEELTPQHIGYVDIRQ